MLLMRPIKVDKNTQVFVSGPMGNHVIYQSHKAAASIIGNISCIQQPMSLSVSVAQN